MSIIAVKGVPAKWTIPEVVKKLAVAIKGPFEVLNFQGRKGQPVKICYVRLSERLDPVRVMENITNYSYPKFVKLVAFLPDSVPDLPLAKKRGIPKKLRQSLDIPELLEPYQVTMLVHQEIMTELQAKYPELYNLSLKTQNKLLNEIAKIVFERLKSIVDAHHEATENCFRLSMFYRRTHPHFGDFQLILSTLHKLQDANGAPRMQINESELAKFDPKPYTIGNVPFTTVQKYCKLYNDKILASIKEYVNSWDMKTEDKTNEETITRNKIRSEMKKVVPYMPTILTQLTARHFMPEDMPHHRVRLYGEPFMPNKNLMQPFLKQYTGGVSITRSNRMFNLMLFKIPQKSFLALMAMDGTVIHGAKILIRNDMPTYSTPKSLKNEMLKAMGAPIDTSVDFQDEADLEDDHNSEDNDDEDDGDA